MTDTLDKAPAAVPPEQIKAIPVRHYGRWVAGALVIAVLVLIGIAFSNAKINYSIIPDYLFDKGIVSGAWTTLYISVLAMVLGVALRRGAAREPSARKRSTAATCPNDVQPSRRAPTTSSIPETPGRRRTTAPSSPGGRGVG